MKLPKGLRNEVVLRSWTAHGHGIKGSDSDMNRASFVSPILRENVSDVQYPHVVTLSLRPFNRPSNLSVDSLMASNSPRRACSKKQKFTLKPLAMDQKNSSSNIHAAFGKEAMDLIRYRASSSSSRDHERIPHGRSDIRADRPHSNYGSQSKDSKAMASAVPCCDHDTSYLPKQQTVPESLYTIRNTSFRPPPRISHLTGQKLTFGNTFGFNYHSGYINILQSQANLAATGTSVTTIGSKQSLVAKPSPRYQTVKSVINKEGCKYTDPLVGCSPGFQARMAEITQHELDTIKWERGKKGKKKSSSG